MVVAKIRQDMHKQRRKRTIIPRKASVLPCMVHNETAHILYICWYGGPIATCTGGCWCSKSYVGRNLVWWWWNVDVCVIRFLVLWLDCLPFGQVFQLVHHP